jgi:modulator of FtsH protease HflK
MLVSISKKIGLIFSLNDPRWGRGSQNEDNQKPNGKKPNDGQADLDQLWRDFNVRLSRLFGGNKGRGSDSGGSGSPDMKGAGIGAIAVAFIIFLLWLSSGFFTVQQGQTAVVLTFGERDTKEATPGINWRWPYPIQTHEIVNILQNRAVEIGYRGSAKNKQPKEALMLTDDENIIDIQFAVQYNLKSASDWIFNNRDQEDLVKQVAEASIREIVGKNKMDIVLYERREQIAIDVGLTMQRILDQYKSGVQITNVTMQGVQPPEQVQAAFDDAVKAGQDRERQKNEGQAYANDVIPRASGAASRLQQESEAYRARVIASAQGDASRFKQVLSEYQKAPAVTRDRMYLETMQQIFANTTKVMVDAKNGNNLLYLPLDKLISQNAAVDAASKPASATTPSSAAPASSAPDTVPTMDMPSQHQKDPRSRESRDREVR